MEISQLITSQALFSIACVYVAERRGGSLFLWFIFGLIFGPLALAVALSAGKKCKYCASWIPKEATMCRECYKEQ